MFKIKSYMSMNQSAFAMSNNEDNQDNLNCALGSRHPVNDTVYFCSSHVIYMLRIQ